MTTATARTFFAPYVLLPKMKELLEKLVSWIPGYAGYAARESRRESDAAVRRAVADRLGDARRACDRLMAQATQRMRFDALEPLETVKRRIERLADSVRHAPAGYSALFDANEIDAAVLDRLVAHDGTLRDLAEALVRELDTMSLAEGERLSKVEDRVFALEDTVRRRDAVLGGEA